MVNTQSVLPGPTSNLYVLCGYAYWSCHRHGHLLQCVQNLCESKTLQIYLFNFLFIHLFAYLICV